MDAEMLREFALSLPHTRETLQWGNNLVLWVGDKTAGGKMFALVDLDGGGNGVVSLLAGREAYEGLIENEGVRPAPYFARIFWVAIDHWDTLPAAELRHLLALAHQQVWQKLTAKTRTLLEQAEKQKPTGKPKPAASANKADGKRTATRKKTVAKQAATKTAITTKAATKGSTAPQRKRVKSA